MKPNEYNTFLLQTVFILKLKDKGFIKIEKEALKMLLITLDKYLIKYLKSLNKHIQHSERSQLSYMNFITNNFVYSSIYGINLYNLQLQINKISFNKYNEVDLTKFINEENKEDSFLVQIINKYEYLTCNNKQIKDVIDFPPAHTFKRTKFSIDDDERNYRLMELGKQRLAVKGSLVKVDEDRNLEFINFMFQ